MNPSRLTGGCGNHAWPGQVSALPNGDIDRAQAAEVAPSPDGVTGPRQTGKEAPSSNGNIERDSHGRFVKGNRGGPGNPFAREIAALRRAVLRLVTAEDIQDLAEQLLARARKGDLAAIKILFAYSIGRPVDTVDPDTLDLKEWQAYHQNPSSPEEIMTIMHTLPPDLACTLIRAVLPVMGTKVARHIAAALQSDEALALDKAPYSAG